MTPRAKAAPESAAERIRRAVLAVPAGRYLLAVSGGRDSMVLLDAFIGCRRDAVGVATYDHATGPASRKAAALVDREAVRRSIPVVSGVRTGGGDATEAAWRAARWTFLHAWAATMNATIVTAHTRDDQIETVVIRILRDAGARGLAGMYAETEIVRPLLDISRREITAYAKSRAVRFVDDPSNQSFVHLRNRVRHQLLPALERQRPGIGDEFLDIARRASDWRTSVEQFVSELGIVPLVGGRGVVVPAAALMWLGPNEAAVVWPAIAARVQLSLDWRGTERLAAFTVNAKPGTRIPLSGGAEVQRTGTSFVLRNPPLADPLYS